MRSNQLPRYLSCTKYWLIRQCGLYADVLQVSLILIYEYRPHNYLIWSCCRCFLYGKYFETYCYPRCYASDLRFSTHACCATLEIHSSWSKIQRSLDKLSLDSQFLLILFLSIQMGVVKQISVVTPVLICYHVWSHSVLAKFLTGVRHSKFMY